MGLLWRYYGLTIGLLRPNLALTMGEPWANYRAPLNLYRPDLSLHLLSIILGSVDSRLLSSRHQPVSFFLLNRTYNGFATGDGCLHARLLTYLNLLISQPLF